METVSGSYCDRKGRREVELPAKLSDVIEVALRDLARVEKSKKYRVDMGTWHDQDAFDPSVCVVCFAGAVMAKTLGADKAEQVRPTYFPNVITMRLHALDRLRYCDLHGAILELEPTRAGLLRSEALESGVLADFETYEYDRKKFKATMRKIAAFLAARGL